MANKIMKTLTIGENTYEVVDETARNSITEITNSIDEINNSIAEITPDNIGALDESEYYGIVRKEGNVAFAESLEGLAIGVTSNINFVQSGEGDASADNVRPITGWDTVSVTRTGKNIFGGDALMQSFASQMEKATVDEEAKTITYPVNAVYQKNFPVNWVKPNTQYTIFLTADTSNTASTINMKIRYADGKSDDQILRIAAGETKVYVTESGRTFAGLFGSRSSGTTILRYDLCGVIEGVLTADDFVPYEGVTLTAGLPETIYGGTYDWNTGVLTVNYHMLTSPTPTGEVQSTTTTATPIPYATIKPPTDKKCVDATKVLSNRYTVTTGAGPTGSIRYINGSFLIYDNELTNENLATKLDGLQICYPVEPTTYQLTPRQLTAIDGINNVWSNCGDTCAMFNCTYDVQPDATLVVSGMAADAKVTGDSINEINDLIGDMTQLTTTAKTTLVDAINEVNAKAVNGGTSGDGSGTSIDNLSIEAWGDSLTFGAGAAGDDYLYADAYPSVLSSLVGHDVFNYGVGGETIETILGRMGVYPMMVMPSGDASSDGSGDSAEYPVDYWEGYKTPLIKNAIVYSTFGTSAGGYFPYGSSGTFYLYAVPVTEGKTYQLSSEQSAIETGYDTIAPERLCFTSDKPVDSGTSYTATLVQMADGSNNVQLPTTFTVPEGAAWAVFAIRGNAMDEYEAESIYYSMQEITTDHPVPTYPTQTSAASAASNTTTSTVIPATTTAARLYGGIKSITGADVAPLLQSADKEKGINPCSIGGIEGTLSYNGGAYYFTRSVAGDALAIDRPTPIITSYMQTENNNRVLLLWIGQNNAYYTSDGVAYNEELQEVNALTQRLIDSYHAIIDYTKSDKYIILSAPISDPVNGGSVNNYASMYKQMQYAFGMHYLNITDYLINYGLDDAGITATTDDTANIEANRIPASLRSDGIHLNADGYQIVAEQVYKRGQLLGYWE